MTTAERLDPRTSVGTVALTVRDLAGTVDFYATALGLIASSRADGTVALTAVDGEEPLVVLHGDPDAPARDPRAPGLFHLALRLPDRRALAEALLRLAGAGGRLAGASDHLVSEALYLSDPEGNGIELYRDREREQWPFGADGTLEMATLALDLEDLLSATDSREPPREPAPAGTTMGHVHLQVPEIPAARAFYVDALGFDPTVEAYPGALFVSAGGYHHHLGLNTWNSRGARPSPPGSSGLRSFEILVPDGPALAGAEERLTAAGLPVEADSDGLRTRDPAGAAVGVRVG